MKEQQNFPTPDPSNLLKMDEKEIKKFLSSLEQGDLAFNEMIQYGFALFGITKAGKTTFSHYLVNNSLRGELKDGTVVYARPNSNSINLKQKEAVIGHTSQSQTQIPNEFQTDVLNGQKRIKVRVIDCPGYLDSQGCFKLLANGYFHYRVFSKVKNMKFIIVIEFIEFQGIMEKAGKTVEQFLQSFANFSKIQQQIFGSTVFAISKTDRIENIQEIMKKKFKQLAGRRIQAGGQYQKNYTRFLEYISENSKFVIFEKATPGLPAGQNTLLQKINGMTPNFWSRQLIDDKIDMQNINYNMASKIQEQMLNTNFRNQFEALMSYQSIRLKEMFSSQQNHICSIQEITTNFFLDSANNQNQHSFFDLIKKFNQRFHIFEENVRFTDKRKKLKNDLSQVPDKDIDGSKITWIQKLQIAKKFLEITLSEEFTINTNTKRTIPKVEAISKKTTDTLWQLRKLKFYEKPFENNAYSEQISKFCYIIYRVLEEYKVFMLINQGNSEQDIETNSFFLKYIDFFQIYGDFTQNLINSISMSQDARDISYFEEVKKSYILNFDLPPDQTTAYYKEVLDYARSIQNQDNDIRQKINDFRFVATKEGAGGNNDKKNNIVHMIDSIKDCIQIMADIHSLDLREAEEKVLACINQLGEMLMNIEVKGRQDKNESKRDLKFAIRCFKSTKNVFRVVACYKLLLTKYIESERYDKKELILEFGLYAASNGRRELAIELYQEAYSLIWFKNDKNSMEQCLREREKIAKLIGFEGIKTDYCLSDQYYEDMLTAKYYQPLKLSFLQEIQSIYRQ